MADRKKGRSLFQAILIPQFFVLAIVILILTLSMPISGAGEQITRNYQEVISLQTTNQSEYLASFFNDNRLEVSVLSGKVCDYLQNRINAGAFTPDQLVHDKDCYESVLVDVSDALLATLHSGHASGAYIILNNYDTDALDSSVELPCLYLRDQDTSAAYRRDEDLTVLYAPELVCNRLFLATDENWQSMFCPGEPTDKAFFYKVLSKAQQDCSPGDSPSVYGRWTLRPYETESGMQYSLAYSEPLILADGTVIGIVGIDLLPEHLAYFLPSGSLLGSNSSGYILSITSGSTSGEMITVINGCSTFLTSAPGESFTLTSLQMGGYSLTNNNREFYADISELSPYSTAPTTSDYKVHIIGVVGMNDMFSFANHMTRINLLTILLTLLVGIVSAVTVSRRLTKPISKLASEVSGAHSSKDVSAQFTDTGIEEIDNLSAAFRDLLRETVDTSTKFLSIMDMASVELAGYEWREGNENIYVTDNFFPMLGMEHVDVTTLSTSEFSDLLTDIRTHMGASITLDGSRVYCITRGGKVRYVRAESTQDGDRHVGLLEDVTRTTLERIRVEHERDYDVLTGLYNRRAFYNRAGHIFTSAEDSHYAALIVMDTDDLKVTNDRFGHDWGDKYLRQTAQCIQENTPSNALCARISGDELYVLLHGYTDKKKLRTDIERLMKAIRQTTLQLPNGETMSISVSGGIAVYPDDSLNLTEMIKYADFAMYQAKNSSKGFVLGFDPVEYAKNETFIRGRGELRKLIEQENVSYHFQPLFSAVDARPAAYEALMRVNMPSIKSPDVVLRLAAAEGSQYQIERITMFKASETYRALLENGQVDRDAMLFINSLPDQCLTDTDAQRFHEQFEDLQSRIVLEITEDEYLGLEALEVKRKYPGFSGNFALDDYGSGYNGEKNLLLLQPRFVKVDVVFIRGIDSNPDRQQLVSSLVTYAHGRDMKVVAEGIETAEELQKVLELGVDLFQGYFLARPAAIPGAIAPQAEEIILKFQKEQN